MTHERRPSGQRGALLGALLLLSSCSAPPTAPWPEAVPAASGREASGGPIVLITLEALRADSLASLGAPPPGSMPHFDGLVLETRAAGGWVGFGIAPSSWTAPVMASIFTGLDLRHHGILHPERDELDSRLPTLAENLTALGFTATAFPRGRPLGPRSGMSRGFQVIRSSEGRGLSQAGATLAALSGQRELVWVHLSRPTSAFQRFRPGASDGPGQPRRVYAQDVAWLDRQLDQLLNALKQSGQWETSWLVVTALHGVDLGDPGPPGTGSSLDRGLIEVPLVVKRPAGASRRVLAPPGSRVSLTRLYATLVEAAGGQAAPAAAPSLFALGAAPVLSELYLIRGANRFSWLDGDRQLLWTRRFAPATLPFSELQAIFGGTPPLTPPAGERPELRLLRWHLGGTWEPLQDPIQEAQMAAGLAAGFLRGHEQERSPGFDRWARLR